MTNQPITFKDLYLKDNRIIKYKGRYIKFKEMKLSAGEPLVEVYESPHKISGIYHLSNYINECKLLR